jgi:hypothetical protein
MLTFVGLVVVLGAAAIATQRQVGLDGQAARRADVRRELMRLPETPIAAVKSGDRVRIKGPAQARGPLRTSPVSQRACICFRLTVYSSHQGDWHKVLDQDQFDCSCWPTTPARQCCKRPSRSPRRAGRRRFASRRSFAT